MKKELKFLYSKIYNNGELLRCVLTDKQIKLLNDLYKNNSEKFEDFSAFESSFVNEFNLLKKSPAAYLEYKKQFNKRCGLQPAILTECFMTQTIAEAMGLTQFYDYDGEMKLPQSVASAMFKFIGKRDNTAYRYIYSDENAQNILIQCGSSTAIDVYFIKNNKAVRIEYKEKLSKLGEFDLTQGYDENGKLIITEQFKQKNSKYVKFIEMFNSKTNVFEQEGHNWSLFKNFPQDSVKEILEETFIHKEINLYCFQCDNFIIPILPNFLFESTTFDGSEIRTAGRNATSPGRAFTYNYIKNLIYSKHGTIVNDVVKIPVDELKPKVGRGKSLITRYKLSSLIFVPADDLKKVDNDLNFEFLLKSVRQLKPSISIHLQPKNDKDILKKQMDELNKN